MKPKTVGRVFGQTTNNAHSHISGLPADSIIMTLDGERYVADLAPGDRVVTRDSGVALVKSISSVLISTKTVRILAGSLGHTRPERDVTIPSGQPVLVRDWRAHALFNQKQAMVPAYQLIDGEFITDAGEQELTLYRLSFDAPHVLYVDGLELASDADAVSASGEEAA